MPGLSDLLADLTSGDDVRAEAAVPLLVELGEEIVVPLQNLMRSTDADVRWWATRALASLPSLDPAVLLPSLEDPEPEVRQCAALGLSSHPSETAIDPLVNALRDKDGMTAELAAKALSTIGSPAVDRLLQELQNAPLSARIHAMHALSEIADPRSIRIMIAAMSEESAMLHHWADAGLEKMGVNMVYFKP